MSLKKYYGFLIIVFKNFSGTFYKSTILKTIVKQMLVVFI